MHNIFGGVELEIRPWKLNHQIFQPLDRRIECPKHFQRRRTGRATNEEGGIASLSLTEYAGAKRSELHYVS
jgi:hypothetical protein